MDALLGEVGRRYPDQYTNISKFLTDTGRNAAYLQGETLNLNDFAPVIDKEGALKAMDAEIRQSDAANKTREGKEKGRLKIWARYATDIEKATSENAKNTNLGRSVTSGARGNAFQLKAMLSTPALYTDYKDKVIPMFVRHGFAEGLRPNEYLASTFGTRRSIISTKQSTAKGGDFLKMLVQSAAHINVTEDDCGTSNGLDFDVDNKNLKGRVLARDTAGVAAGTTIDKHVISQIRKEGVKTVLARSPMTCTAKNGICAHCLGLLSTGHFAPKGYAAGITAGQSLGEPIVQGALSDKHTGGGFKGTKREFSGFKVISDLVQSPEIFPDKATVSEESGKVGGITDAPQGGKYVTVGDHEHYVLPDFAPTVKVGDSVEAGDSLSEGVTDASDIVRLRGLGEGRRYFVDRLKQAMTESGAGTPTDNNLEIISRGALDHVKIDDPEGLGSYLPDDVVSYNTLARGHVPPATAKMQSPDKAVGKYLHAPALHLTIGTKLTPKMADQLKSADINHVIADESEPAFHPEMVRLRSAAHNRPDWLAKMHTSYLTSNIGNDAARARDTNIESNDHFAPRLGVGTLFGVNVEQTGKF